MIYTNVTVKINNNGVATASNKVVLYRGDREVEIQMTLSGNPFIVKDSTFAQLIIRRENAAPIITGISPLKNSKVVLVITEANIDELTEVGSYAYQIRLYDDDMSARVTLPPVENGIEVREPIVDEASGRVGRAMINYSLISTAFNLGDDEETFNEYGEYNRTYWMDGDFITDVKMNKIEDALYTINQKVISNAETAYVSTNMMEDQKVGIGESLDITFDFVSPNLGKGTLKVLVNGIQKISQYVEQETTTINLPEECFTKGENKVSLYVIDRAGKSSNELIFLVRYGSTEITSDFDAYTAYVYGSSVRYYFIPSVLDTSMALTFYMTIDGEVKPGVECTSDVRGYYTFPNNLSVGSHFCQAYIIDAEGTKSNVLEFNLIILDAYSIVIASDTRNPVIEEGTQLVLDYKVYMQNADRFIVKTYIDDAFVSQGECGLATAYYRTSSLTEGTHTIKIEAWNIDETISDYVVWSVVVTESSFEKIVPATAGSIFSATALDHSNSDPDKETWIGVDQDGNEIEATLSNFAFNSDSGWIDNELIFNGIASVEVPVKPLYDNARYGFTLDIEFTSKAVGVDDALVLDLWDYEKDCGIKITTETLRLRSAEGNEAFLYFEENANTSVIFVIDRNEAKAKIYLNGVMCSAFNLSDYQVEGEYILEDFSVDDTVKLGGGGYCKIRNLRIYQVALTTNEIINNFISNKQDKEEQKELVEFQNGLHLPTLTIYGDFSGLGKDDKKPCKIVYSSTDEEKYGKSFTLDHKESLLQYQGTSSMAYPIKNYRINLRDENGDKLYYDFPYGKPETRLCLKADFMSSGHWQNTGLTKWINNNLYNYNENDEKSMNPKKWFDLQNGGSINDTRECIYGFPCRLILVNDGTTPLNAGQNEPAPGNTKDMGIFNFNHDKDCTDTMGFDKENFPNCMGFEVAANSDTSAGAFMRYTGGGSQEDELEYYKQSFELRFPDEDDYDPWYGFLGINAGTMVTEYLEINGAYSTTYWNWDWAEMLLDISSTSTLKSIECWYYDELLANIAFNKTEGNAQLIDGTNKIRFIFEQIPEYFHINDTKYIFGNKVDELSILDPYLGQEISSEYGIKRLVEWVDTSTDEEFVRDFEQYFHKDYTLRYYLLVMALGMVDNLGKNMMLDSWDGKIFAPRFYDCDTICSYDNTGDIAFDVDIEMEQGYWNTSSSRLWTRVRDLMHVDLVAKYNDMRQNGLSYESLMQCFYDEQIAKIPQKYYNMDFDVKYAPFGDSYMGMAHGDGYEHLKRWLKKRLLFTDSLFDYAPSYNNDVLTIRANTTEEMTIYIETYDPVYQHVSWYNGQMDKKKVDGKIAVTFSGTAMAATDQEVLIYGGSNIKKISGISSMNPGEMMIGSATRLVELDASNSPILANINQNKANLSPHTYLTKINLSNCPMLGGNLRINQSQLIQEIDISNTAISGINFPTYMRNLKRIKLSGCENITSIDLSNWDTTNVTDMSHIFQGCTALTSIDGIANWNTSNVTDMGHMFNGCGNLASLDVSNFNTSKVTNMNSMFYGCSNLTSLDVSNWNTGEVTSMNSMFRNCSNLTSLNVAKWNTTNVVNMDNIFQGCFDLSYINARYWPEDKLIMMANGLPTRTTDSLGEVTTEILSETLNTILAAVYWKILYGEEILRYRTTDSSVLPIFNDGYSYYVDSITTISDELDEVRLTSLTDFSSVKFTDNTGLTSIEYLKYNDSITDMSYMFDNCTALTSLDVSNWNTSNVTDMKYMFNGCDNLTSLNVSNWNTSKVVSMNSMFDNCTALTSLDVSYWNTSKVTDMSYIFNNCNKLTSLDVSNWNTSKVTDMLAMFRDCSKLTSLDVSNFDTSKVTDMNTMFHSCNKLTSLDVSNFDTSNVTDMYNMFSGCNALTSLDVSNFDTSNVTDMYAMFRNCSNLTSLDVSNFDTSKVTSMYSMFNGCSGLKTLNVEGWPLNDTTQAGVSSLPAGNGIGNLIYAYEYFTVPTGWVLNYFNPYDIANYNCNASGVVPAFNTEYTGCYSVSESTNSDGTYKVCIRTNDLDVLPTKISFRGKTSLLSVEKLNTTNVTDMSYMFHNCNQLTSLDVSNFDTSNVTDMTYMFGECGKVESLDTSNWNTGKVTNMGSMFTSCGKLTSLNVSNFDTSNVTNMSSMFRACLKLTSLDVSNFDTSKVANMNGMFYKCGNLTSLDVSNFDTSNVTDMSNMFDQCTKLTSLDVSNFDTSKVTNISSMFYGCTSLRNLDLSSFDTSSVTNMNKIFFNCASLTPLDISNFDTSKVTNMGNMFQYCKSLTSLDLSIFDTTNVTNMDSMFQNCPKLISLNLSSFDTSKVTSMSYMFDSCSKLTSLNLSSFDTSKVTNTSNMFAGCSSLKTLNVEGWPLNDTTQTGVSSLPAGDGTNQIYASEYFTIPSGWVLKYVNPYDIAIYNCNESGVVPSFNSEYAGCYSVSESTNSDGTYKVSIRTNDLDVLPTKISFKGKSALLSVEKLNTSNVTDMNNMFYDCKSITSLDISNWNTSNVATMNSMFNGCSNLTSLDVSNWTTSNVADMVNIFYGCSKLTSLDISNWNTSNVTNMNSMFSGCNKLTSLDVSNWNTSNVTDMSHMFNNCNALTSLDVSNFDTSKVANMTYMFQGCNKLTSLDVSNWNTSNVTTMNSLFRDCSKLTSLDVSNFDTSNVTSMSYMFSGCNTLTSLDVSNFDTSKLANMTNLFRACLNLTSLDVSNWNTSNVTSMANVFYGCNKLTSLDVSNWNTSNVTNMYYMFYYCNNLTSLDLSNWDTNKVTNMGDMFDGCSSLKTLNVEGWPLNDTTQTGVSSLPAGNGTNQIYAYEYFTIPTGWVLKCSNPYDIAIYNCNASGVVPAFNTEYAGCYTVSESTNSDGTYKVCIRTNDLDVLPTKISFSGKTSLLSVEILNTSNVTDMSNMFSGCGKLTSLDVSNFDTSNITDMTHMFRGCNNLTSLDVSNFNTSNVTTMTHMFRDCNNLTSLDVSNWNTSNVTDMSYMFNNCKRLTSLDVSNWNTSKVTNMGSMFHTCEKLTSLDLSNFDTSKVTSIVAIFSDCTALTSLDVSNWNTSNVTTMAYVFNECSNLISLDVSNWNTSKVTDTFGMFGTCNALTSLKSMSNIQVDLSLSDTLLDTTSLIDVIDNLSTVTSSKTLTLGYKLRTKLTSAQIAVATNKGWTVA